jgi:hypothetical protein
MTTEGVPTPIEPSPSSWEDMFPLSTFYGETKKQLVDFINILVSEAEKRAYEKGKEKAIVEISEHNGWEETEDFFREKLLEVPNFKYKHEGIKAAKRVINQLNK